MSEKKSRCLIVDDDRSWFRLLQVILDHSEVGFAASGAEALRLLEAGDIVLLITDTNMPDMNGIELLQKIRADERFTDLPVVLLFSGLSNSNMTRQDVLALGATLVMTKEEFLVQHRYLLRKWLGD